MKTIIVGGGKVGYYLTKTLLERDYDVSVVEVDREVSQYFANMLDVSVVCGDGTSRRALEKAGIEHCETVVAVTGKDEVNLIVCQIAKRVFNVPKTIAKVNNPKNVEAMESLGIDRIISGIDSIIKIMEREVDTSRIKELLPLNNGKAAVYEIIIPEDYVYDGKMLCDLRIPEDCNIISITRGDDFIIPRGKTRLFSRDVLMVVSADAGTNELRRVLKIKK